jgi:hypothetical protein
MTPSLLFSKWQRSLLLQPQPFKSVSQSVSQALSLPIGSACKTLPFGMTPSLSQVAAFSLAAQPFKSVSQSVNQSGTEFSLWQKQLAPETPLNARTNPSPLLLPGMVYSGEPTSTSALPIASDTSTSTPSQLSHTNKQASSGSSGKASTTTANPGVVGNYDDERAPLLEQRAHASAAHSLLVSDHQQE